ncbi:TlpA family protein disulfide reductase [Sphingobium sp. CR28]|uniref:TlpA family protein disulfide reductase n=1 Tax=Sphingobium sp. CR28 TaxID=3400272 RepID=UPI003FEF6F13
MRAPIVLILCGGLMLASGGCDRRSGEAGQGAAPATNNASATSDEVLSDEVPSDEAGNTGNDTPTVFKPIVDRSHAGEAMPDKPFQTLDGKPATLKQLAGGKPLLVNLWATWCAPCVAELPMLDKVAATMAQRGVSVAAVSQDQETAGVTPFWKARKLGTLRTWLDPENALGFHYATGTLPTTVLYDGQGKEIVRVVGALDWNEEEGKALLAQVK